MFMNQDLNNSVRVNDELQDNWLNDNLKLIQVEPPLGFTQQVLEKIELKPNPLSNSPIFWILAVIPGTFLVWLVVYALNALSVSFPLMVDFLPKISNSIPLFVLSKYVLMIVIGGLFFIGLDYFLNRRLSHRESFFSFILV